MSGLVPARGAHRPPGLLHHVLAGTDPDAVAVRFCGPTTSQLTYRELDERSNRLAHALVEAGVGPGGVVALLLARGLDLLVAQLGVLKAGAAWMPLDPQHPGARLAFQVDDARAALVLTSRDLAELAPVHPPHWCLDDPPRGTAIAAWPDVPPDVEVRPDDAAYLIYTSGSTGTAKGVLVSHRSAYGYCENAVGLFTITPADRLPLVANPAFDMTIFDCFATLLGGGTVIGAPLEVMSDPDAFTTFLCAEQVTVAYLPTTLLSHLDPQRLVGSALRALDIGSESLTAAQVNRWARPGLELHNSYGPTETTVVCTDHILAAPLDGRPPIGSALADQHTYVLDRRLRPVPVGVPGQLFIAGIGVAHGYLNRSSLTAERFLADPYGDHPGQRMYASGDLARWRSDGLLEYLGRIDRQVKLRGQRIELGEIEHVLAGHTAVRQCSVVLHDDTRLVGYLVGSAAGDVGVDLDRVRGYLADRLPTYMIPTTLITVPELPLTANGKLDAARLPEPAAVEFVAPRTDTERWLATIWQELLEVDLVGAGDSFFDHGGNSLHLTQLIARIRDRHGIELHPRQVFSTPALERLADLVDSLAAATARTGRESDLGVDLEELDAEVAELEQLLEQKRLARVQRAQTQLMASVPREPGMVCTYQQEGLWFVHQLNPKSSVYHIASALRLRGDLDVASLGRAMRALVIRHEALRTRFVEDGGVPRQVIDPPPSTLPLSVSHSAAGQVEQWIAGEMQRPLNLAAGPVFRASLARLASDEYVLVLVVHHIVADGWSAAILADELSVLYAAETGVAGAKLAALNIQPADHAAWQRRWLNGAELERQLGYWRERLADLPPVDVPTDRPRPAQPTGAGATVSRRLPAELVVTARRHARRESVSFLAVLQAALLTVLHRYTGQTDLATGSIFSGRTRPDIEPLVGFFANTLVLRTDIGGSPTFAELVRRCHETVVDAAAHQDLPFGLIVDALQPERMVGRNPLFQISLSLQPARGGGARGGGKGDVRLGELTAEPIEVANVQARFDLAIDLSEVPDGALDLSVEYATELFDQDRIDRFVDHYTTVLAAGLASPELRVTDIELMSIVERHQVLHAWNPLPTLRAPGLLHRVIAGHDPEHVALRIGPTELSYRELDQQSSQLARALRRAGIALGHVVGLLLDRGPHLPVAQLAVLKCGAAWMSLDPQLPPVRLAFQTDDASARLVLTTIDLVALAPVGTRYWCLDDPRFQASTAVLPSSPPDVDVRPEDPAYLLYTSGSTGRPKGVLVSHRSAYAYCENAVEQFRTTPADRVAQVSNPAFDASIFDCFATLLAGATMVGVPRSTIADPRALTTLLLAEGVTLAYLPPAILAILEPADFASAVLRGAFSAGEALGAEQANRWAPGIELHNCYGPTETTVVCMDFLCPPTPLPGPVPIGRALPNHRTYVLDARLRPVPVGIPGQLLVSGTGVTYGYLGRPSMTAEQFLPDPFGDQPGQRMYATGDIVRWRSDGVLQFLGRSDRQVKLRGQRAELGEIEHALDQHPDVRQSAVVLLEGPTLAAYLTGEPVLDEVREFLATRLPTYMIPTVLVILPELPLTLSGKVDTARLPAPATTTAEYIAPCGDTERWLATIWQELLEVDLVGAGDNFFDLGGNSLHATRLVARVRDQLNLELHLRHLFTSPTLGQLAGCIDQVRDHIRDGHDDDAAPTRTDVIALRPRGTRPPLFLVHPVGGSVTAYARLAPLLGDDQPVYAIEDPALYGATPPDSLVERARRYADLVRRVQPAGPYHIGGWSLGGLISLEMARELTGAGEKVALVVALDSSLAALPSHPSDVDLLTAFVHDLAGAADVLPPDIDFDVYEGCNRDALAELTLDRLVDAGLAPAELRDELRVRMDVLAANLRAMASHRMRRYDGRVAFIGAAEEPRAGNPMAWGELVTDLVQHTVPGNHFTMLTPPHLSTLAATLREVLQ